MSIKFVFYNKARCSVWENLDMIPVLCLLWELTILGNSHAEHTNNSECVAKISHRIIAQCLLMYEISLPEIRNITGPKVCLQKVDTYYGFNLLELGLESHLDSSTLQNIFLQ